MWRFLLRFYRLYREPSKMTIGSPRHLLPGSLFMRPQKWGKVPRRDHLPREAFGPTRLTLDAAHEPVGRAQPTPWIQIVATSEEQTDNTWLAVFEMATRGRIAELRRLDIGIEDINLRAAEDRAALVRWSITTRCPHTFANLDETGFMLPSNAGFAWRPR